MINIGDKVKIREDLDECIDYGNGVDYVWSMEQYKGKIAKIVDKDSHNLITIDLDKGKHYWTIEMFEDKELTKYKRAFEILKDMLHLEVEYDGVNAPTLYVANDELTDYDLTLEEAELLEELMKSE